MKYSVAADNNTLELSQVRSDRDGVSYVLSSNGLLQPSQGQLVDGGLYRPFRDMKFSGLDTYKDQFVYLNNTSVFSNGWAGKHLIQHNREKAHQFAVGDEFSVLLADGAELIFFRQGKQTFSHTLESGSVLDMDYSPENQLFYLLTNSALYIFYPEQLEINRKFSAENLTALALSNDGSFLVLGTRDGLLSLDTRTFTKNGDINREIPWTDINCVEIIEDKIWAGTPRGAFALDQDGSIDYYASKRWLVDDHVVDIAEGPENSVLILSKTGLARIQFQQMTLADKAEHFLELTRKRHVRYGFNARFEMSEPGNLASGRLTDDDNDGLWTGMYLGGELFRYAVTKSEDALRNSYEAFEALERLERISPMEGFPARSFERTGYTIHDKQRWQHAGDDVWDWKATTSSDEIVGHFFAYALFAEIVPDSSWRQRAISLMDKMMMHIVRNDWYLVDYNGQPTQWGRWAPEYVNQFPKEVGDRRLNSVEIISFLQTAHHFTERDLYREKAYELFTEHGYLDNLQIPIERIGRVEEISLSSGWNHSDDNLAFLSYWNLYRYAFTDSLRDIYRIAIKGHWEIERPERIPLWNFIYKMTGANEYDLDESIWFFREFPLDMVDWSVQNSHRLDIQLLEPNFRDQTTQKVLPPDERPMAKFNRNAFDLDSETKGYREYSGDIYLLPYWMGKYLNAIQ
ncbi:MAG: hypothetical protein GF372_04755 [Candidatus Marinimicrobia bacterium]|nr:hypothetical protein [Candidatus Neomarinimicrobiota bacterium]